MGWTSTYFLSHNIAISYLFHMFKGLLQNKLIVKFPHWDKNRALAETLVAVFNVSIMKDLLCETWSLLKLVKAIYNWLGQTIANVRQIQLVAGVRNRKYRVTNCTLVSKQIIDNQLHQKCCMPSVVVMAKHKQTAQQLQQ